MIVFVPVAAALGPLMIRTLLVFPHGVMPRSRWLRALPFPFAIVGLAQTSMILGIPYSGRYVEPFAASQSALALVVGLALAARVYRRADPVGRRQLKVSFLGIYLACIPGLLAGTWLSLHPEAWPMLVYAFSALGLVPAFIYMALHRYDVFDVDGLLSATAAYNVVLFLLAGAWLFLAPQVGELAAAQLGIPASTGQIAASIGLAALIVPAQRRLQPRLEALFFKQRHALEVTLTNLADELGTAPDAKGLLQQLGVELHARVRPESTVLYGRDGARYVALFVEGRGVPAELPADGPVVSTLCSHHGPVCVDGSLAGQGERSHDPFVRAALEVLNASVVIPISGGDGPPGTFVALGAKRSGDLYTGSELHLLRSLADRAALELRRFGEQETRAESRAMHEAMRRYVPGAIAEHIERGDALEPSEREVTVLFVDIRGYTTLSEGSRAEEVFSTINRYTRTVSELVRETGGTVVEFNGDGMMAVFGAPEALPDKERAAVRAARRIADEVADLEHAARPLSVSVGVATGRAFVGNIQAADRMIWSAIGNTTNLAARLQSLTRELDVAVIIDAATQAALGDESHRFRCHEEVAIRGRGERIDVFALRGRRPS